MVNFYKCYVTQAEGQGCSATVYDVAGELPVLQIVEFGNNKALTNDMLRNDGN